MDLSIYDPTFMLVQIPDKIDPWRAAQSCQSLNGTLASGLFGRIPAPGEIFGPLEVWLNFSVSGANRVKIDLRLRVEMAWCCQRCLTPVHWTQTVSRTVLVMDPETNQVTDSKAIKPGMEDEIEAITVARGGLLSLYCLIEDELLLALPFAPKHEYCEQSMPVQEIAQDTKENPFAALTNLRVRKTTE